MACEYVFFVVVGFADEFSARKERQIDLQFVVVDHFVQLFVEILHLRVSHFELLDRSRIVVHNENEVTDRTLLLYVVLNSARVLVCSD